MPFFEAAYAAGTRPTRLLDADPDLLGAAATGHPMADAELRLIKLQVGRWAEQGERLRPRLGFLVLDGVVARRVTVQAHRRAELVGPGDVIRPWEGDPDTTVEHEINWEVVASARLAVLDDAFVRAAAVAPDVLAALAVRAVQRAQRLALQLAMAELRHVDDRLLGLFRLFGDRWGRVTPQGVHLSLRMTHELIAELVGAKRPTVTTALGLLDRAGTLVRMSDRTWLLRRAPDGGPQPERTGGRPPENRR